jgi:adapter protein MecA 1/2
VNELHIERINDDQIKIILTKDDLTERDLNFTDLSFIDPIKIHLFFTEIMDQITAESGFNAPLLIDVVPTSLDDITLIITKASSDEQIRSYVEAKFSFLPIAKMQRRFRQKSVIEPKKPLEPGAHVFCIEGRDELAAACRAINGGFSGRSIIYRHNGKYYLVLHFEKDQKPNTTISTLREFGQQIFTSAVSPIYLQEHGEVLIGEGAVGIVAAYM